MADELVLFVAARVLKAAGFEKIADIIKKIYGVEVRPETVRLWCDTIPSEVERKPTLLSLVQNLTGDKLRHLAYIAGAVAGDGDCCGKLRVKDLKFAAAYAASIASLLGEARLRKLEDQRLLCRSALAKYMKQGLWKVFTVVEPLYFLSGLLDAEGSISPKVNRKEKKVALQICFGNTNYFLSRFVYERLLTDFSLQPVIYRRKMIQHFYNGKQIRRRKPLYQVCAFVPEEYSLETILKLLRITNKQRERKVLEFFLATISLDPHERYELFLKYFRKQGKYWQPVDLLDSTAEKPEASKSSSATPPGGAFKEVKRFNEVVKCFNCGKLGTLVIEKDEMGAVRFRIQGDGHDEKCSLTLKRCPKCYLAGYAMAFKRTEKRRRRRYLVIAFGHYVLNEKRKVCEIKYLRILDPTPPHPPSSKAE